jgi:hypothetical protein
MTTLSKNKVLVLVILEFSCYLGAKWTVTY